MLRRLVFIALSVSITVIGFGCSNKTPEEKIYEHLEETVVLEETFEEEQEKINELELKDEELYDEIIKLEIDDFEKIVELADEAIVHLDKRLEHLKLEQESIEESKAEFLKMEKHIEKLTEDKKEHGEKMFTAMTERFKAYDHVYDTYVDSIDLTKRLYRSLKEKEVEEKEIVSLITDVNDSYEAVFTANDEFNEKTEEYNDLKKKFYQLIQETEKAE